MVYMPKLRQSAATKGRSEMTSEREFSPWETREEDYEEEESEVESVKSNADHYIKKFGCKRGK